MVDNPNLIDIQIACLPEDPDVILGYSILSKDHTRIVWVFVKSAWRNKGIGTHLLPDNPVSYMHFTDPGLKLIKRFPNCIFNPF